MDSYLSIRLSVSFFFFFFNDTATTEIYTLSLHDALPICCASNWKFRCGPGMATSLPRPRQDRKSTRLNSSHSQISYAVFCLKKKKTPNKPTSLTTNIHRHHRAAARSELLRAIPPCPHSHN